MLTILQGDVIEQLRTLPDESVHCCVTSPPYWGLRDYGTAQWEGGDESCDHVERSGRNDVTPEALARRAEQYGTGQQAGSKVSAIQFVDACRKCRKCGAKRIDSQLGLEKTPEEYVAKMVEVFRELRRVLRKDGTLWLNLGDSYAARGGDTHTGFNERWDGTGIDGKQTRTKDNFAKSQITAGLKPKDLCGMPWRVAFALQADGWWLRSDIIWAKPNPMPESVTDRPTKAHEYLFLLTKSANYFYDAEAIKEQNAPATIERAKYNWCTPETKAAQYQEMNGLNRNEPYPISESGRNKRSVWTVATAPYPEAHFATYPPDLIKPCILAGTSAKGCCTKCGSPWERIVERGGGTTGKGSWLKGQDTHISGRNKTTFKDQNDERDYFSKTIGWQPTCGCRTEATFNGWQEAPVIPCTVLDPFAGSGTTGTVALELGRKAILIELNPKYVELIKTRCNITSGFQLA